VRFHLTIRRFRKGKKNKTKTMLARYQGFLEIPSQDVTHDFVLDSKLPVKAYYDAEGKVICRADLAGAKVFFYLMTRIPQGKLSIFRVGGKDAKTGKHVNWSACISAID